VTENRSHSVKHKSDQPHIINVTTWLRLKRSVLNRTGGRSRLNGHPDSPKPGTGDRNNGIKIGSNEMAKYRILWLYTENLMGWSERWVFVVSMGQMKRRNNISIEKSEELWSLVGIITNRLKIIRRILKYRKPTLCTSHFTGLKQAPCFSCVQN
jgi:hypothetical protein